MGPFAKIAVGAVVAGAATFAYASLIERNMFTLRRYDVPVLAPEAEPIRVLHLSDLHLTPEQERKKAWVAALAGLDPDLVLVTGDNLGHPDAVPGVLAAYAPLLQLPGAFVFGSNDYTGPVWHNPLRYFVKDREYRHGVELPAEELRAALTTAGWADVNNRRTQLKAGGRMIDVVGVDDPHIELDDYPSGTADPHSDVRIALSHAPEPRVLDAFAADGYELLLAGHTHGGQVRVPGVGALVTNCGIDRRLARGLHRWASSWLHVSAGLGTHPTAPIRFACRPEATLLTLIPR